MSVNKFINSSQATTQPNSSSYYIKKQQQQITFSSQSSGSVNQGGSSYQAKVKFLQSRLTNFLAAHAKNTCEYCKADDIVYHYQKVTNTNLFQKYSSSQNYYYTKEINEILSNQRNPALIRFKDQVTCDEEEEYLKRYYQVREYQNKIKLLTEYYKFHKDIPRLFMLCESIIMNNFHDKKRRIEYYKIAQLIEDENKKHPERPPKGIVGDKPG